MAGNQTPAQPTDQRQYWEVLSSRSPKCWGKLFLGPGGLAGLKQCPVTKTKPTTAARNQARPKCWTINTSRTCVSPPPTPSLMPLHFNTSLPASQEMVKVPPDSFLASGNGREWYQLVIPLLRLQDFYFYSPGPKPLTTHLPCQPAPNQPCVGLSYTYAIGMTASKEPPRGEGVA